MAEIYLTELDEVSSTPGSVSETLQTHRKLSRRTWRLGIEAGPFQYLLRNPPLDLLAKSTPKNVRNRS